MAILDLKKKIEPYLKTATGYVKQMLSSKHVVMEDGNDLETTVTELNRKIDPYRVIDFNTTGRTTYVKYANGVMIQFGTISVSYTDGYGTAAFTHPFIDTSYVFFTTGVYGGSEYLSEILTCQKISNNKAYIYSRNPQGNKVETHNVDWIAIGRWK